MSETILAIVILGCIILIAILNVTLLGNPNPEYFEDFLWECVD